MVNSARTAACEAETDAEIGGVATGDAGAADGGLRVDLDALAANYRIVAAMAPRAETAPVVKADAYGLGAGPVARRLWAEGARSFFVARLREGVTLRAELGPARPAAIYVLDGCAPGACAQLEAADLTPVLNSVEQIQAWSDHGSAVGLRLPAALHLDTGLNRLGLGLKDATAVAHSLARSKGRFATPAFELALVMSHLVSANEPECARSAEQARRFVDMAAMFPGIRRSLANSGGVFLGPEYHFDLLRPGMALYGGGPFGSPDSRLLNVATLRAPILQMREIAAGETVGYGPAFQAVRSLRIAIVAAGYADGVLRAASRGGYGWLQGSRCDFVGRVSMDLIALDVTNCEAARPGALVELLGANVPVDDLARAADTISYEILVRIGARTPRTHIGDLA